MFEKSFFSEILTEDQLARLLIEGKMIFLNPGEALFDEGATATGLFVILSGKLEIHKKSKSIAIRGEGELVGEMALLDSKPRSASVRSVTSAQLLEISWDHFNHSLALNPRLMWKMVRLLSERCRDELEMIESGFTQLKWSEDRYRTIVQSISDIIIQVSPERKIDFINSAVRALGYDPEELIQRPVEILIQHDDGSIPWNPLTTRRSGARVTKNIEVMLKTNEGSPIYDLYRSAPYLVSASGLWNVPNDQIQDNRTQKIFLGTLWVARQKKLDLACDF